MNLQVHPGYVGLFTREEADGGIPNGARVVKIRSEEGDGHPVGSLGTVLGSIKPPPEVAEKFPDAGGYLYFVEWDATPRVAVGLVASKIAASR